MSRPTTLPRFATVPTGGYPGRVEPNSGKKDTGFDDGEEPPAGEHNWLFGIIGDWITYLNDTLSALVHNWTLVDVGAYTDDFNGVGFGIISGERRWVAVGVDKAMYSTDGGQRWLAGTGVSSAGIFRAVAYGNGKFVAV